MHSPFFFYFSKDWKKMTPILNGFELAVQGLRELAIASNWKKIWQFF